MSEVTEDVAELQRLCKNSFLGVNSAASSQKLLENTSELIVGILEQELNQTLAVELRADKDGMRYIDITKQKGKKLTPDIIRKALGPVILHRLRNLKDIKLTISRIELEL